MMMDYDDTFVKLCEQLCSKDTYSDESKVKAHNSAMKELAKLQNDMRNTDNGSVDVYGQLLVHKNDMVKLTAAAQCIQVGILKQKSIKILKRLSRDSQDSICRFDAEMILKTYR